MLDTQALRKVMPSLSLAKAELYLPRILEAAARADINTNERLAAWLGQLAHESGEFKYWEEIWGPTAQQLKYETTLAKRLGNINKGDGYRYRGRGPIQLTGRDNYRKYGALLGLDLVSDPDAVSTPAVGFLVAATFWLLNGLNPLADKGDYRSITKRINGGLTHYTKRVQYSKAALVALREAHERQTNKPMETSSNIAHSAGVDTSNGARAGGVQSAGDQGGVGENSGGGSSVTA